MKKQTAKSGYGTCNSTGLSMIETNDGLPIDLFISELSDAFSGKVSKIEAHKIKLSGGHEISFEVIYKPKKWYQFWK